MKTRVVWILAGLAVLVAAAVALGLLVPGSRLTRDLTFAGEPLPEGVAIEARTVVPASVVHRGDAFAYVVEVRYDPAQVAGIDRTALDRNVILSPFELRDSRETGQQIGPTTRVYRREYTLQLLEGEAGRRYEFPSIVIRYRTMDGAGYAEKTIVPEPVYVASLLPADASGLELRPLRGQIVDPTRRLLPWILWALAAALALLGVADLVWRGIPRWRAAGASSRAAQSADPLVQGYRSLRAADGADPRRTLHQMECLLRIVLARQTHAGWLAEPDLAALPGAIRPQVEALYARCQDSHEEDAAGNGELATALAQLDAILAFYYGAEVEAWQR